jgi:hypothetical protein
MYMCQWCVHVCERLYISIVIITRRKKNLEKWLYISSTIQITLEPRPIKLCYNAYIDKTYICIYIIVMDADLNLKGITCLNEKMYLFLIPTQAGKHTRMQDTSYRPRNYTTYIHS